MPNRIIHESCRASVSLSKVSYGAECMFWRLLTAADDYGRFEAENDLILANCYKRSLLRTLTGDILTWKEELEREKVIRLYRHSGKEYGYFVNWTKYQRVRAATSKFPDPRTSDSSRQHMTADDSGCQQMTTYVADCGPSRIRDRERKRDRESRADDVAPATEPNGTEPSQADLERGRAFLRAAGLNPPETTP